MSIDPGVCAVSTVTALFVPAPVQPPGSNVAMSPVPGAVLAAVPAESTQFEAVDQLAVVPFQHLTVAPSVRSKTATLTEATPTASSATTSRRATTATRHPRRRPNTALTKRSRRVGVRSEPSSTLSPIHLLTAAEGAARLRFCCASPCSCPAQKESTSYCRPTQGFVN